MKIAIEGMDGVGKSTISKMIAEKFNLKYLEKPVLELFKNNNESAKQLFNDVCRNVYDLDSEVLKAWFFGLGNLYTFIEHKDENIIVDRHFASNYFWNGSLRSNDVYQAMINLIGVPDITIVLYASWEVRRERIRNRDKNDPDLTDEEKMVDGYDKMCKFMDDFSIPYCIINTENKDIDTIVDEVSEVINNYCNKEKVKVK